MTTLDNVTVTAKANIYFDGKCISHSLQCADGSRKSVGVIFPSTLTFNTGAPETMEITGGRCRVRLAGASEWQQFEGGQQFEVGANSAFDIETLDTLDYIC
ncbi:MAG: pyrimidine/purine nucleoside phosphorylase, partial [Pseudomonadota bacterium]|nr:pyrimidine/purine nucleoside phosphorylase [Pseudomonadota bacterium]